MPAPKKPHKSKTAAKNQYTADLSSSQMVLGITIVMVFGLACFLLGVLIGKFDPSLRPEQQVAQATNTEPTVTATEIQTSRDTSSTTAKPSGQQNPKTKRVVEEKDILVVSQLATTVVKPAVRIPESATATTSTPKTDEPKSVSIPSGTVSDSVSTPESATVKYPKVSTSAPTSPTLSDVDVYAVQIAAFKDATMAERERKRLEAKLPFKIDILKRQGDVYSRLLIGHYATKPEATVLKEQLISKYKLIKPYPVRRN